jgi:NMD protein affecting ribosome stability and mRNA decay
MKKSWGFDICYKCGKSQDYGTMKELNPIDFDILCDSCYSKKLLVDSKLTTKNKLS